MTAPFNPSVLAPFAIGALILWRFYSRVRRMVGRQKLSNVRPWITVCVFPLLAVFLAAASYTKPLLLLPLLGGIAVGVALGIYGLRVTRFESAPEGLFYTPSAHVGIALSLLFMGRIIYRLIQLNLNPQLATAGPQANYATTPLTLLIFGLLAGYYVTYAVGLLRWKKSTVPGQAIPADRS
jgi:hypothetical protein